VDVHVFILNPRMHARQIFPKLEVLGQQGDENDVIANPIVKTDRWLAFQLPNVKHPEATLTIKDRDMIGVVTRKPSRLAIATLIASASP